MPLIMACASRSSSAPFAVRAFARGALFPLRSTISAEQFDELFRVLQQMETDIVSELGKVRAERGETTRKITPAEYRLRHTIPQPVNPREASRHNAGRHA